jgi:hypothetical protein
MCSKLEQREKEREKERGSEREIGSVGVRDGFIRSGPTRSPNFAGFHPFHPRMYYMYYAIPTTVPVSSFRSIFHSTSSSLESGQGGWDMQWDMGGTWDFIGIHFFELGNL